MSILWCYRSKNVKGIEMKVYILFRQFSYSCEMEEPVVVSVHKTYPVVPENDLDEESNGTTYWVEDYELED
jgi:hypothetical protein